jgi:hypothetical protein
MKDAIIVVCLSLIAILILIFALSLVSIATNERKSVACWQQTREEIWVCKQVAKKHCKRFY